jgi:hypothetical protein
MQKINLSQANALQSAIKSARLIEKQVKNYKSPAEAAIDLAELDDKFTKLYLAQQDYTPAQILNSFSKEDNEWIKEAVAINLNTDTHTLLFLLDSNIKAVNIAIAKNLKINNEIVNRLLLLEDEDINTALAGNENLPSIYFNMLSDKSFNTKLALAVNNSTPGVVLDTIVKSKDKRLLIACSINKNLSEKSFNELLKSKEEIVLAGLALNDHITTQQLSDIRNSTDSTLILKNVSENPKVSHEDLIYLASNKSALIRVSVAKNTKDQETLDLLSKDGSILVLEEVAKNPNTHDLSLKNLLEFDDKHLNEYISVHLNATPEILEEVFYASYWKTRLNVLDHYNCPENVINFALSDKSEKVRNKAKKLLEGGVL